MVRAYLLCLVPTALMAAAADPHGVVIEHDAMMKTRDGVALRADVYRPKGDGKFPVLLKRTPYNKGEGNADFAARAAALGYVVIVQDVRGRFASDGEWYPFKYEASDGYDAVEWAAALPCSNGKVGMIGDSYVGATQMLAAIAQPPHLAGIMPGITASNYHDGWTYQGGAFLQWFNESWTSELMEDTLNRRLRAPSNTLQRIWQLPLNDFPFLDQPLLSSLAPYFTDWIRHPGFDDYWRQWSIEDHYPKIRVPAYHFGGWYDIFQTGTVRNYIGLKNRVRGQRLLMGPWYHGHFGVEGAAATNAEILRWYDHLLRGIDNGIEREKPVRIFILGTNTWRSEDSWPLARAREARYYLHSGGGASTRKGDGSLDTSPPMREQPDRYTYDPADPVPTRGGGLCCRNDLLPSGPFDQGAVEDRRDVLVYTTKAFAKDFEVTGPVAAELYVGSAAVDTDFTAKLVDVRPDGFAANLTDGILRARYRASPVRPEWMKPGEVYTIRIDMANISNVFRAGHKLRVEISSSNFPRFDRNLNTGESGGVTSKMTRTENIVYHDARHPSCLLLPVVGRAAGE